MEGTPREVFSKLRKLKNIGLDVPHSDRIMLMN